ncbi:MAG TPA: CHAP domain-containing protein [Patescibacteria group bacterium]|nr:CHAP domain-containing protein [Patescibacteria group bacterium]
MGAIVASSAPAVALQCVPFAREVSGISIRGNAWTWWSSAEGAYDRGQAPKIGAVVVFKKHGSMRYGHVAVVTKVVNSREVLVDHANWGSRRTGGRGRISKMVAVTDVSPRNDWTEVRVWNTNTDDFGTRVYPTYGFIYPQGDQSRLIQASYSPPPTQQPASVMRMSPPGDPVLATADEQIAMALADTTSRPVVVEVKALEVKTTVEAKSAAKPAEAKIIAAAVTSAPVPARAVAPADPAWEDDVAAAKRVGSGHY